MKRGRILGLLGSALCSTGAVAQSFNIDLDIFFGDPSGGNGAPSDAFGAAANQPGSWNRVSVTERGPYQLVGIDGSMSQVMFAKNTHGGPDGGIGFANPLNTGDYRLLLNDASWIGPIVNGGRATFSISGLLAGTYDVYTYAVQPAGQTVNVPITVPEAMSNPTQIVSGPMPGNAFALGITHSVHRVLLDSGGVIHVDIVQPPSDPNGEAFLVNGFQIAVVPEPTNVSLVVLSLGILWLRLVSTQKHN